MQHALHRVATISVLLMTAASTLQAQQVPSQQRGLGADSAFAVGNIDSVNLFNGSLSLRLGIGEALPVGPNLNHGLTLAYNSNGWDSAVTTCDATSAQYGLPVPHPLQNVGFGWSLHLGRLFAPDEEPFDTPDSSRHRWIYVSRDGGQHYFFDKLHPGDSSTAGTCYSNDGTYLRLKHSGSPNNCWQAPTGETNTASVELPDGTVHEFTQMSAGVPELGYWLTRVRDAYGNDIDVTYSGSFWEITDTHGRTQRIDFVSSAADRVSQVTVPVFDGGTPAVYTFDYSLQPIERQRYNDGGCGEVPETVSVQVLDKITFPDTSFYEIEYYSSEDYQGDVLSGGIRRLRLRTGGEFHWAYTTIPFRTQAPLIEPHDPGNPSPNPNLGQHLVTAFGVLEKTTFNTSPSGLVQDGVWRYDYGKSGIEADGDTDIAGFDVPCHHTTTVTDPAGNDRVTYHSSTYTNHRWSYGLPFTYCANGYSTTGPFLSEQIWKGSSTTPVGDDQVIRTTEVQYGSDGRDGGFGQVDLNGTQDRNHRLQYKKVTYHDDADHYKETTFEDFDGLGHFRSSSTDGDFDILGPREVVTDFNGSAGTLVIDPDTSDTSGSTFVLPSVGPPWMLQDYDEIRTTEDAGTSIVEVCIDDVTGFLSHQRRLEFLSRAGDDLLTVFEQDGLNPTGHVVQTSHYGGDGANLNTGSDRCNPSLPATPEYLQKYVWETGVLKESVWVDPCDGSTEILKDLDEDIDASTGKVAVSRDPAGVATGFSYDALGRIEQIQPEGSAWTNYSYSMPAGSTTDSELTVSRCLNGISDCSNSELTWQESAFDGLGRLHHERIRQPELSGSREKERTHSYDGMGRKKEISTWHVAGAPPTSGTTYTDYDALGRVGTVTPPGQEPIETTYEGDRIQTRKIRVMLGTSLGNAYTTEIYNDQGRLNGMCEDQTSPWNGNCNGSKMFTHYTYDEGGRLTNACLNSSGGSCGQERIFMYDGRGLLMSEQHPEVGTTSLGNGLTTYTYDALGQASTKTIAGAFNLFYRYDPASRLVGVDDSEGRLLEYAYARSNAASGTDKRAGKLVQSKRHNYVNLLFPLPEGTGSIDAVVTQTYRYQGLDGAVSSRQTRAQVGNVTYAFETGWTFDHLENVETLTYPDCQHDGDEGCAGLDPDRTVTFEYEDGRLSRVPGIADPIEYQGGGLLHRVVHANGAIYTLVQDPDGLERPLQIKTEGLADPSRVLGPYSYDGAGNITAIQTEAGVETYGYDRFQRVITGGSQSVIYDPYGNITSLTSDGVAQDLQTDPATNRLLTGSALAPTYDATGSLSSFTLSGETYVLDHDALGKMTSLQSTGRSSTYLYDADGDRLVTFECLDSANCQRVEKWTLRGLSGEVLRVYEHPWGRDWEWKRDYVHRGSQALAAIEPGRTLHFHPDHLGSPRSITTDSGAELSLHHYHPFGGDIPGLGSDDVELQFTGHERDANEPGSAGVLDYMKARYYSPLMGRFLSVDPKMQTKRAMRKPQQWNRYAYSLNNPLKYVDPDGRDVIYANKKDQRFFSRLAARSARVQKLFDYFGPGTGRNLTIKRGGAGTFGFGGKRAAAADVTFDPHSAAAYQQAYKAAGGGKAGEAAIAAMGDYFVQEATITLTKSADDQNKAHELGHVEEAVKDPAGAIASSEAAYQASLVSEEAYEASAAEVYADAFATDVLPE